MNEEKIVKTSEISVKVGTDVNNVPVRMMWSAEDGEIENQEAGAMFLSIWSRKEENTMKMDLWTKELTVDEMKIFFHQTLLTMADTFENATGEAKITEDLRDYCMHFAEKMRIMPEDN